MNTPFAERAGIAAAILLCAVSAGAESWELRSAADDAPGSPEIEAGRPDDAIRILAAQLDSATGITRLAVLENLCVAYAMKRAYDAAMRFCDQAAAHGAASATTLNNRGVVRAVTGDHRGAVQDFRKAACLPGCGIGCDADAARGMARRNLERMRERESTTGQQPVRFRRGV